jgi:hypothetical protein
MAIAQHVHDRHEIGEPQPSRYAFGSLNEQQRKVWQRCRRKGDRAVKVTISWSEP